MMNTIFTSYARLDRQPSTYVTPYVPNGREPARPRFGGMVKLKAAARQGNRMRAVTMRVERMLRTCV